MGHTLPEGRRCYSFAGFSVHALTGCDRQSDGEIELYCWFVRLPGATQSSLVRSPASGTSDDVHHLLTSRQVSKLFSRAGICGRYTDCFTQPPPHTHTYTLTHTLIHKHSFELIIFLCGFILFFPFLLVEHWTQTELKKKRTNCKKLEWVKDSCFCCFRFVKSWTELEPQSTCCLLKKENTNSVKI